MTSKVGNLAWLQQIDLWPPSFKHKFWGPDNEAPSNNAENCFWVFPKINFKESFGGKKQNGNSCPIDLPRSHKDHKVMCAAEGGCALKVEAAQQKPNVEVRIRVSASGSAASCWAQASNVAVLIRGVRDVSR